MKKVFAVLLSLVFVLFMAACTSNTPTVTPSQGEQTTAAPTQGEQTTAAPTQEEHEPVTIQFWDCTSSDFRVTMFKELKDRFEKIYPWITVELLGLPNSESIAKCTAALEQGIGPDCFNITTSALTTFADGGHLIPLDDYIEAWDEKDFMYKNNTEYLRSRAADGKLYYIPYTSNVTVMWYNKTLYDKNSVDAPETWDDIFNSVEVLKDPDGKYYPLTIRGGSGGAEFLYKYIYDYMQTDIQTGDDGYSNLYNEKAVEFCDKYLNLYNKGFCPESDITADYKAMTAEFDTGYVALFGHNLGSYPNHVEVFPSMNMEFACMHMPKGADGQVYDSMSVSGQAITDTCEHPYEAFLWLAYIASKEGNSYVNECLGQLPINSAVAGDAWLDDAFHIAAAMEWAGSDWFHQYSLINVSGWGNMLNNEVTPEMQACMQGTLDADTFVKNWKTYLDKLIDESK